MQIRILAIFLFCFLFRQLNAQTGGKTVFGLFDIANSARLSAVGGNTFMTNDHDLTMAYTNPTLIDKDMNNQLALSFVDYFADIKGGFAAYGYHNEKFGNFAATLQYLNYGSFTMTDPNGIETGTFSGGDYALTLGYSKSLSEKFKLGVNLKNVYSQLEDYNSYGIASDIAFSYFNPDHNMGLLFLMQNIGRQIDGYTDGEREKLPFNTLLSFSKKLDHVPFRFIISVDNLHKWDLTYSDPNAEVETDPFTGEVIEKNKTAIFADKLARHFVIGGEFVPGNGNFAIRFGYDYRRRQEMLVDSKKGMMGFSFGFGLKISKFRISYARSTQHLAGGVNTFTITTKLSDFGKQ